MIIDRYNINEIINKTGIRPDKDFGQNFLTDSNTAKQIVDSLDIKCGDFVLEVGPGLGSLTHFILEKNAKTAIVDVDKRMIDFLNFVYKENQALDIINEDIRKVNIQDFTKIISNLPYNITTELVNYFLIYGKKAETMVFMCQSEAYPRFSDLKGKEYGPSSILVHLLGTIEKVKIVPPGSFYPSPKCTSTVFKISVNNHDKEKAINVYKLCKQLFLNRRKTIYNNLSTYLKDREKALSILEKANLEPNLRPEEIEYSKFIELFDLI